MIEFTKEELELIWEHGACLPGELRPVLDKIKEIIDNYCEHETSKPGYCPGLYSKVISGKEITAKDIVRIYECDKCGEYYK